MILKLIGCSLKHKGKTKKQWQSSNGSRGERSQFSTYLQLALKERNISKIQEEEDNIHLSKYLLAV